MKLIKAEVACAQTDKIIEEKNKQRHIEAEAYIDAYVYPEIKQQIANGCYSATFCGGFVALDIDTRKMVRTILNDYHYEARFNNDLTTLDVSWSKC